MTLPVVATVPDRDAMNTFIGIDPGLSGAVAVLQGDDLFLYKTPITKAAGGKNRCFNLPLMRGLLSLSEPNLVVIERIFSLPTQPSASTLRFGEGYGMWQGLTAGLQLPYVIVTPQAWKKVVLEGTAKDKQAAIEFVTRRFPRVSLLASSRSKKPHDGFADAACLALYGRIQVNGRA